MGKRASHQPKPARRRPKAQARVSDGKLAKVTVSLRPDQVLEIERLQVAHREATGEKIKKSELVQRAVDLLISTGI